MELRKGYKQTDVGEIPEEWEVTSLEDVSDKSIPWSITGGPFGSNLKSIDYTMTGIRIIQLQNIGDGVFNDNNRIYTSIGKANELISSNIYPGDIILSKMGDPVARACLIPRSSERFLMSSDGIRLAVNSDIFSKEFVLYYINYNCFRNKAIEASIGSTRKRINLPALKKIPFIKPPLPEQKAIASALSDIDGLINSLQKLINKKKNIKQGVMQELLTGRRRIEGFSDEWAIHLVGNLGKCYGGLTGKTKKHFGQGNSKYIPFMNVMSNPIVDLSFLEQVNIENGEFQYCVSHGDLIFNTSSETPEEVGMSSVLLADMKDLYLNSFCFGFRLFNLDRFNPLFLSYLFRSTIGRDLMFSLAQGATRYNLSKSNFLKLEVKVPDYMEQTAIATIFYDMDSEIEALEQKLDKYKNIKSGMMQELLTGRIRLLEEVGQ
jgi:type I restriction enzyme S subunit